MNVRQWLRDWLLERRIKWHRKQAIKYAANGLGYDECTHVFMMYEAMKKRSPQQLARMKGRGE